MKKIKSLVSILMVIMLVASCFAFSVSAADDDKDVTLHVTKYQIPQVNGETDRIGNTETITGTAADAPEGFSTLSGVEFTIFKLGELGTIVTDEQIAEIDASYDASTKKITFNSTQIEGTSKTTGEGGVADFTVIAANRGVYFVKETSAPAAVTAKAASFVVNLPMNNAEGVMYDVYVYPKNYTTLGGGILQVKDSSGNSGLAGAKFALYKADDTQVTMDYYGNSIGDTENHYLTTDANGYIYVNNLLVGSYYFKQAAAPEGYMLKNDKYSFAVVAGKSTEVVAENGSLKYDGITLLTVQNSSKPRVNMYVTEINKKTDSVSFGELIRWYAVADIPSDMGSDYTKYAISFAMDPELVFQAGTVSVKVSADGRSYDDLASDKYTVSAVENQKFTVSVSDYAALSGKTKIQIMYKTKLNESTTTMGDSIYNNVTLDYATSVVDESATEANPPGVYTGGYKFLRVSDDNNTPLAGSKFDVYTDYDIKVGRVVSDADGKFEVKGLTAGNYYLVETEAPEDCALKTSKVYFTVTSTSYDNQNPLKIANDPAPKLPMTGDMGTPIFTIVGFGFIALSAAFFAATKKTKKESDKR